MDQGSMVLCEIQVNCNKQVFAFYLFNQYNLLICQTCFTLWVLKYASERLQKSYAVPWSCDTPLKKTYLTEQYLPGVSALRPVALTLKYPIWNNNYLPRPYLPGAPQQLSTHSVNIQLRCHMSSGFIGSEFSSENEGWRWRALWRRLGWRD